MFDVQPSKLFAISFLIVNFLLKRKRAAKKTNLSLLIQLKIIISWQNQSLKRLIFQIAV